MALRAFGTGDSEIASPCFAIWKSRLLVPCLPRTLPHDTSLPVDFDGLHFFNPYAHIKQPRDLIVWLACKEAKALLTPNP